MSRWLLAVALAACANRPPPETVMSQSASTECTLRLSAGDPIPTTPAPGAVLCLGPGVHPGRLYVEHDLTVLAEPGAVLDAGGRGTALHVAADDVTVLVKGLTLRGGRADAGGGVLLEGRSDLTLEACRVEDNQADALSGGGLVLRGQLTLRGSDMGPSDALMITNVGSLRSEHGVMEGDLSVREGARVTLLGGAVRGQLSVRGTTTRKPTVTLHGAQVSTLDNHARLPGVVVVLD